MRSRRDVGGQVDKIRYLYMNNKIKKTSLQNYQFSYTYVTLEEGDPDVDAKYYRQHLVDFWSTTGVFRGGAPP